MTFVEVSEKYGVPITYFAEKLQLPEFVLEKKIGPLQAKYGFKISDVAGLIEEYHKSQR